MKTLAEVVAGAIRSAVPPCTLRGLAADCGVSHTMLSYVVNGQRNASPRLAGLVAAGLEKSSERQRVAAARIRKELAR